MADQTDEGRRNFLKVVAAGGVALAAAPLLTSAKGLSLGSAPQAPTSESETEYPIVTGNAGGTAGDKSPLIVVVKDGKVTGYRGTQKVSMNDLALGSRLQSSFESNLK